MHTNVFLFSAVCSMNVHKRCQKNVANNCGINTKMMAEILNEMGISPDKNPRPRPSKVRKKMTAEAYPVTQSLSPRAVTLGLRANGLMVFLLRHCFGPSAVFLFSSSPLQIDNSFHVF